MSVVINTLDRAGMLSRTLESLRYQTHSNFEVIVINGPSSDSTDALLRQYAGDLKIGFCPERRLGISRNIGLDMAAGDRVAFLDDDAQPEPDWLRKLDVALDDPAVAAAGGCVFDVPLGRIEWRICTCTRAGEATTDAPGPIDLYLGRGADPFLYLAGCNMSFRRSALVAIGGFDEALSYGYDDVDVCCRLIDEGHRIAVVHDAIVHHHRLANVIRDSSQSIRDIHPIIRARAIFSLRATSKGEKRQEVLAQLEAMAEAWRGHAKHSLDHGIFTREEFDSFVRRIDAALHEGIEIGSEPRLFRYIGV